MFTIKARNFEVKGNIVGFDPGSENLLVTFDFPVNRWFVWFYTGG